MADKFTIGDGGITNSGFKSAPQTGMDEEEFATQVLVMQADAVEYIDGFVQLDRALAQSYYLGDFFNNEEEGRSQIVMTIVRDTILAIVPELLRLYTASDKLAEFSPNNEKTVEQAEQQTDLFNHIFWNDNNGFRLLHNAFKDALTVKTGVFKWRWSEDTSVMEAEYTDLEHDQLMMLQSEPDTEILEADPVEKEPSSTDALGNTTPAVVTYDVKIRRKKQKDRVIIECVPPEEFIVHRETRDLDTSPYVGHRSLKTKSDLVAMGYDRDDIDTLTASDDSLYMTNIEAQTRNPAINLFSTDTYGINDAAKRVVYVEQFIRIDKDGDGIAELRKVCSVGRYILHDEVADGVHFADICPDPTPHMLIGQSIADQTMDLQLITSSIVRDVLDSLKQSINPRTWAVEGQVNMDDVLNNEVGGVIRMRQPGMAGEFTSTFVGQQAIPVLAFIDGIRQRRTGVSDASAGLDPDVLQSTTKAAVTATVTGAQARIEMIARLFGDGIKRMAEGVMKMVIRHQDKPRTIRLRNKFVTMDPRFWDSELDAKANVALGRGTDQDKLQFLMAVKQTQEQIIQLLGPANPLAPVDKYRNTLVQICHLMGFKDDTKFFGEVDPAQMEQNIAAQQANKPQDPTIMLAQIEQAKVKAQVDKNMADAQHKHDQMLSDHAQAMMKMRLDAAVRIAVAQISATGSFNEAQLEALISHDEAISTAQIQAGVDQHATVADALSNVAQAHIAANAPQQVQ